MPLMRCDHAPDTKVLLPPTSPPFTSHVPSLSLPMLSHLLPILVEQGGGRGHVMLWFLSLVVWGLFANIKKYFHQGASPKQHAVSLICGARDKHLPDTVCPSRHAMLCSFAKYKCGISISVGIAHGAYHQLSCAWLMALCRMVQ